MKLTQLQELALRGYAKARTLKQISGPLTLQDFQEESKMSWAQLNGVVTSLRQKEIVQVDSDGVTLTPNGERWLIENRVVDEDGRWIDWEKIVAERRAKAKEEFEREAETARKVVRPLLDRLDKVREALEKAHMEVRPREELEADYVLHHTYWNGSNMRVAEVRSNVERANAIAFKIVLSLAEGFAIELTQSNQKLTAENFKHLAQVQAIVEELNQG